MEEKAIFEIGNIIHIRYKGIFNRTKLTAKEITESYEYKQFKKDYPELCKLVEK
ncbi:hypothetical protein KKA14_14825 [bacterium]|nr:hypothetical protein [bacterium]